MRPPNNDRGEPINFIDPWLVGPPPIFVFTPWDRAPINFGKTFALPFLLEDIHERQASSGVRMVIDGRGEKEVPLRYPVQLKPGYGPIRLAALSARARLSELATAVQRDGLGPEPVISSTAFSRPTRKGRPDRVWLGKRHVMSARHHRYSPPLNPRRTRDGRRLT